MAPISGPVAPPASCGMLAQDDMQTLFVDSKNLNTMTRKLFSEFDKDGNGQMDAEEVLALVNAVVSAGCLRVCLPPLPSLSSFPTQMSVCVCAPPAGEDEAGHEAVQVGGSPRHRARGHHHPLCLRPVVGGCEPQQGHDGGCPQHMHEQGRTPPYLRGCVVTRPARGGRPAYAAVGYPYIRLGGAGQVSEATDAASMGTRQKRPKSACPG
jgi:hypothetical protein